jgi:hypothetical protein
MSKPSPGPHGTPAPQSWFSPVVLSFDDAMRNFANATASKPFRFAGFFHHGVSRMSIRVFAFALLAVASLGYAAPPKKTNPPPTQDPAESIDVDAIARAKDANGATPPAEDAPPQAVEPSSEGTPTAPAPTEAAPAEASPSDAPAAEAAPTPAPEASAAPTDAPAAETAAAPAGAMVDATKPPPPSDTEKRIAAGCVARATSLLDEAQKADYGNVTRDFDAKMRTDMPAAKFKQQWESLSQFGKLVARGQSHLGTGEGYTVVMIPLIFEKNNLVAQINCGSDGRIAGFHVTEAPKPQF